MSQKSPPTPETKPDQAPFFARGSKGLTVQSQVRAGNERVLKAQEQHGKNGG